MPCTSAFQPQGLQQPYLCTRQTPHDGTVEKPHEAHGVAGTTLRAWTKDGPLDKIDAAKTTHIAPFRRTP